MPPAVADVLLRIEALSLVQRTEWFSELGSTNDYALSMAGDAALETPRLIWADRQTSGRGRNGHAWWSAAGALTFSLLLDGDVTGLPRQEWPKVSLLSGLAVAAAISEFVAAEQVEVKWPNDVYLAGKKVCGILMEPSPDRHTRLVVGMGVNVSNSFAHAPADLQAIATAICDHTRQAVSPEAVLLQILREWRTFVNQFQERRLSLPEVWQRRCYLTDHEIRITHGETLTEGRCLGIDDDGALLLMTRRGRERRLAGTVRRMS
jgi:BirA family transcriptional regulator, biotin operon repressor / biotin---[acetyl-CoA-carboxylase] ligase